MKSGEIFAHFVLVRVLPVPTILIHQMIVASSSSRLEQGVVSKKRRRSTAEKTMTAVDETASCLARATPSQPHRELLMHQGQGCNSPRSQSMNKGQAHPARTHILPWCLLWTMCLACVLPVVAAIPLRGTEPWSMVLCKFRGNPSEPRSRQWFSDWMTDSRDEGSIVHYFDMVSNGVYSVRGSNVWGWYTLPYSTQDVEALAVNDPALNKFEGKRLKFYYKAKQVCTSLAERHGATLLSEGRTITVVNDRRTAVFCRENGVLLTPRYLLSSALAHEMAHSFFIGHSYSDKRKKVFPYSAFGEYDDQYDLMSTANALMHDSRRFGLDGPGLNGPHLDFLGWLPSDRIYYLGSRGEQNDVTYCSGPDCWGCAACGDFTILPTTPLQRLDGAWQFFYDNLMPVPNQIHDMYDDVDDMIQQWCTEFHDVELYFEIDGIPEHLQPNVGLLITIMFMYRFAHLSYYENMYGVQYLFGNGRRGALNRFLY